MQMNMTIASRNGKHRKNVVKKHNDVKVVKTPKATKSSKAPRPISKGLKVYNQILRTVRDLFPYDYRECSNS